VVHGAAFVFHVAGAMPMIAVPARRAVIMRLGDGALGFENMERVIEYQRQHAGHLGHDEQP
jgi:hypothetical protein